LIHALTPPQAELREMVDLYKEKGFSQDEAETILRIMAKYKDFFVDHMLVQVRAACVYAGDVMLKSVSMVLRRESLERMCLCNGL
jgi:hypothetical protein